MKTKHILSLLLAIVLLINGSCTDRFEDINRNPNKFYSIDINQIFPGTVLRTMQTVGELNLNYLMTWSRYATRQAFCGPRQDVGSGNYQKFYVDILRDLENLESEYEGKVGFENRHAIVKTWKAYCYYVMVSLYGGIPMSDAILNDENKTEYRYDTEKEVYTQILDLLSDATELYNPTTTFTADVLSPDPVFGGSGNTISWRKFANTLRLNIAMQIQNIDPELSRKNAAAALAHEDWLISSNSENVAPHWGTSIADDVSRYWEILWKDIEGGKSTFQQSTYPGMGEYFSLYLYTFKDPRMQEWFEPGNSTSLGCSATEKPYLYTDTITRPHNCVKTGTNKCPNYAAHQADGLNSYRRDSLLVQYTIPYTPIRELVYIAQGWEVELVDPTNPTSARYSDPLETRSNYNPSFLKKKFTDKNCSLPIISYTDVCFLKAEAAALYGLGSQSAQSYYEEGIRASFDQLGISGKAAEYMSQNGVRWNTNKIGYSDRRNLYRAKVDGTLDQIYKQRYFAGVTNFLEGWNLERRTRAFDFPPFFSGSFSDVEGSDGTYNYCSERLIYPKTEISQNRTQYYAAIENLRATSPWFRPEQEGNNIFTSLEFAKKIPNIGTADSRYKNLRIIYHAGYLSHYFGITYEEMLAKALATTGETNPSKAMTKAYNYTETKVLSTYLNSTIDF